ncbi:MAG: hypothetical protein AAFV72_00080 [Cyanobacteria bacterium J06635_1]
MIQQRIYLPAEYAELVAQKAAAAKVSPALYVQTLIAQDHICGSLHASPVAQSIPHPPQPADDSQQVRLSDNWDGMTL